MTAQFVIILAIVILATINLTMIGIAIRNHLNERKSGWAPARKNLHPSHYVPHGGIKSHYRCDSRDVMEVFWKEYSDVKEAADESTAIRMVSSIHAGKKVDELTFDEMDYDTMDLMLEMLEDDWLAYYYGTLAIGAVIDEEEEHLASLANDPKVERHYYERERRYMEDDVYPETHLTKKRKASKRWLSYDGRPMSNKKLLADFINC